MSQPRVVLASHNAKKLKELREVFTQAIPGLDPESIVSSKDLQLSEPVENGTSFEANALIKARAAARESGLIAVADDSGLTVDILGGAPGIFSARWCGHHGDDAANNALLLAQLSDIAPENRGAAFVCAAALVIPAGVTGRVAGAAGGVAGGSADEADGVGVHEIVEIGTMRGRLLREARGAGGFGYDPLFVPEGYEVTSAELSAEQKNAISHRGKAMRAVAARLAELFRSE